MIARRLLLPLLLLVPPADAAVAFQAYDDFPGNQTLSPAPGTLTVYPNHLSAGYTVANNDVILITVVGASDNAVPSTPTGYTQEATTSLTSGMQLTLFWKRSNGAAESDTNVSVGGGTGVHIGLVTVWSGCATSGDPIDVVGTGSSSNTSPLSVAAITTTTDNGAVVAFVGGHNTNSTLTPTGPATTVIFDRQYNGTGKGQNSMFYSTFTTHGTTAAESLAGVCCGSDFIGSFLFALKSTGGGGGATCGGWWWCSSRNDKTEPINLAALLAPPRLWRN